ncbi:MAG: NAD(P)/FAD-dependent oxidoreductase [Oligosphaeraceae bacterium]
MMEDLVILGSGPAGCTAAIYAARAGYRPVILAGNLPGGLLTQTPKIENYPGFPEPVSGFDLMDAMIRQAERLGARLLFHTAREVTLDTPVKRLVLDDGSTLQARAVILAIGARHRQPENKGKLQGKNVSFCATCDGHFYKGKTIALAGNGSAALNEALFLCGLAERLHLLVPAEELKGPQVLRERLLQHPALVLHLHSRVQEIQEDEAGRMTGLLLQDTRSGETATLPVQGLFLALGFEPDTALLEKTGVALTPDGYIKRTSPQRTATNLAGVFAAGDCTDPLYKQAVIAAATGAMAGMDAAEYLRSRPAQAPLP